MKMHTLIVPCAGRGSRFLPITKTPKPLIPIAGRPMLDWAFEGMRMPERFQEAHLIFHRSQFPGEDWRGSLSIVVGMLHRIAEEVFVNWQESPLQGAAHSIYANCKGVVDATKPVAIWNCDQVCWRWNRNLPDADGHILTFIDPTKDPKWSYVRKDEHDNVVEVAEKRPISSEATIGAYFFRRAGDLFSGVEAMMAAQDKTRDEYYLAPVYNYLVKKGLTIKTVPVEWAEAIGTPSDLDLFCERHYLPSWKEI